MNADERRSMRMLHDETFTAEDAKSAEGQGFVWNHRAEVASALSASSAVQP